MAEEMHELVIESSSNGWHGRQLSPVNTRQPFRLNGGPKIVFFIQHGESQQAKKNIRSGKSQHGSALRGDDRPHGRHTPQFQTAEVELVSELSDAQQVGKRNFFGVRQRAGKFNISALNQATDFDVLSVDCANKCVELFSTLTRQYDRLSLRL